MSFHEFSVTLKEKLSPPTEEDQQRELPDDNNEDKAGPEWRLLRLRYMTRPTFSTGSKTAVYLPHSNPDVEHVTNDGQHGTPRKVASKTGISAVETEQRIFAENNRRFEPHFIELDAGLVDKVMHEVATMMTEGKRSHPLRRAYERFQKRGGQSRRTWAKNSISRTYSAILRMKSLENCTLESLGVIKTRTVLFNLSTKSTTYSSPKALST